MGGKFRSPLSGMRKQPEQALKELWESTFNKTHPRIAHCGILKMPLETGSAVPLISTRDRDAEQRSGEH